MNEQEKDKPGETKRWQAMEIRRLKQEIKDFADYRALKREQISRLDTVIDRVALLRLNLEVENKRLRKYARHADTCPSMQCGGECTCGFSLVSEELPEFSDDDIKTVIEGMHRAVCGDDGEAQAPALSEIDR